MTASRPYLLAGLARLLESGLLVGLAWALAPFLWSIRNAFMPLEDTYKPLFIPFLQFRRRCRPGASS